MVAKAAVRGDEVVTGCDAPFEVAFRVSPAAMVVSSIADTRVLEVNDATLRLLRCTREELVGHRGEMLQLLVDPGDRERCLALFAEHGEVREMATRLRSYRGDLLDVVLSIQPILMFGQRCALTVINDVTALRAAERTLEEAQTIGRVGSWSYDVRAGRLEWSKEARRMLGVDACGGGDDDWRHLVDLADLASVLAKRERALGETGTFEGEYPIVRSTGERLIVHARGRVERDADGNPLRLVGVLQDVTEQRAARDELRRSEALFASAFRSSPVAMGVLRNRDMKIIDVNDAAAKLAGRTRDELIGRTTVELGLWLDPGERTRMLARVAAGDDVRDLPVKLTRKDGAVRVARMSVERIQDGEEACMLAVVTDVTEAQEMQHRIARLAAIVESSSDAITSSALDGTIETWNGGAERLYGYSAARAIGMNIAVLVPPELRSSHRELIAQLQRGEVVALETTCIRNDGTRADIVLTCSPVLDSHGNVVAIASIARDISAQRHAQKMEAIGALAGGIAHDFNNILSVVLSSATLIEDAVDRCDPIIDDVRAVREAAERAATLTRQLLAFSRRQVLEPKVVNLDKAIAGMEKMVRRLLGGHIELVMNTGHAANVVIDPGQFEQVILNLVVNARDAMPGGGRLCVETTLVTHNGRGYVQVMVTDTGVGMDDTTRQRMFEPFFTTKERGKGTGLGLATVFGIVEQSGGFVSVDSARGRGTTIAIFIPRTDRTEVMGVPVAEPQAQGTRTETILVVEDEELVRRLVIKMLRREGYEVLGAANAGEALLIAEQRQDIDVLLTDVVMPHMNGRQLAERLCTMSPGLRVAFMSGYHDDEVLRELAGASGVVYLQKPVPRDVLVEKLRELLDGPIIAACGSPRSSSS